MDNDVHIGSPKGRRALKVWLVGVFGLPVLIVSWSLFWQMGQERKSNAFYEWTIRQARLDLANHDVLQGLHGQIEEAYYSGSKSRGSHSAHVRMLVKRRGKWGQEQKLVTDRFHGLGQWNRQEISEEELRFAWHWQIGLMRESGKPTQYFRLK